MYCLKCGRKTGRDDGLCDEHADDPVTENSLLAVKQPDDLERCPACNQYVRIDLDKCPSCGATLPVPRELSEAG